jgi:hypothetical protein
VAAGGHGPRQSCFDNLEQLNNHLKTLFVALLGLLAIGLVILDMR